MRDKRISMSKEIELKRLITQAKELRADFAVAVDEVKKAQRKVSKLKSLVDDCQEKIDSFTVNEDKLVVSEHAIIRYIERSIGIDRKEIIETILEEMRVDSYAKLGDGKYPIGKKLKAVIKSGVVVTVVNGE